MVPPTPRLTEGSWDVLLGSSSAISSGEALQAMLVPLSAEETIPEGPYAGMTFGEMYASQEAEHLELNYSLMGFLHIDPNAVPRKYLRYTAFLARISQMIPQPSTTPSPGAVSSSGWNVLVTQAWSV